MDAILNFYDSYLLTPYIYPITWAEDYWIRQLISLFVIVSTHSTILYLVLSGAVFYFIYDKNLLNHPKFLKNQIQLEIQTTMSSIPLITLLTILMFLLEIRGYSKLYDRVDESSLGWWAILIQSVTFILFTDMLIYWIHRGLHSKLLYKPIHKPHHKWIVPTPFASHAFHPIDGFLQSLPYHLYVFLFPMHKYAYLAFFAFVNIWTVSIHDSDYRVIDLLKPLINGSAHHTDHHIYFTCNYGQFFTLWDRIGNSFKEPSAFSNEDPKSFMNNNNDEKVENKNRKIHLK